MSFIFNVLAKFFKCVGCFFEKLAQTKDAHERQVQRASSDHDMASHPDEPYYAVQYLYWIQQVIDKEFPKKQALALDLGCGQGRLTVPLATYCHKITGVDFTKTAIESARLYARQKGCGNIDFIEGDLLTYLETQSKEVLDFIILTEVVFFLPTYKKVLDEIFRVLKPGGMAFISFRSQYFDVLFSVQNRKWEAAKMAVEQREGYLWGGQTWFSWQTKDDVQMLLQQSGFREIDCAGIGVCSGIEGDPLAGIVRPSLLDTQDKERLQTLETRLAKDYVNNGRYILAMARK